jgi:hypothetical protein
MRPPRHLLRRHPKHDDTSIRLGSGHKGIGTYIALTSIYSWLFNTTGSSDGLDDDGDDNDDDDDDDAGGGGGSKAIVDNSCMQSREVWTGTTYALAAAMIHESLYYNRQDNDCNGDNYDGRGYHSKAEQLTGEERRRLRSMAFNTSRGM